MESLIKHLDPLAALFPNAHGEIEQKPGRIDKLLIVSMTDFLSANCVLSVSNYCILNDLGLRLNFYPVQGFKCKVVAYFWRYSDEILAKRLASFKKPLPLANDETKRTIQGFIDDPSSIAGTGKRLAPLR